jgi:hypothetical protein
MAEWLRKAAGSFAVILLVACLVVTPVLSGGCRPAIPPPFPAEAEQAARMLLSTLTIPGTSLVIVTGPVEPGTVMREDVPRGEEPVKLKVPEAAGTYYAFFIDDRPYDRFKHPVRYAYVELVGRQAKAIDSLRRFIIHRPNAVPAPFTVTGQQELSGVKFFYARGEGAPPDLKGNEEPPPFIPAAPGSPVAVSRVQVNEPSGQTKARIQFAGHKSMAPGALPGEASCRARERHALVMDGGDYQNWFFNTASAFAAPADAIEKWLEKNDFVVRRTTQYPYGSRSKYETLTRTTDIYPEDAIVAMVSRYAAYFLSLGPPPDESDDEFFIYFGGHGDAYKLYIYGLDNKQIGVLAYKRLFRHLLEMPTWVKVTLFIDACHSAGVIETLQGRHAAWDNDKKEYEINNNRNPEYDDGRDYLSEFQRGHGSLTIIAVCDEKHSAAAGTGGMDSGTEDFMEGADQNIDQDGAVGDIYDCFKNLERESASYGPRAYHYPDKTAWCSLDGPNDKYPPPVRPPLRAEVSVLPREHQTSHRVGDTYLSQRKLIGRVDLKNESARSFNWSILSPDKPDWLQIEEYQTTNQVLLWLVNYDKLRVPGDLTYSFRISVLDRESKLAVSNSPFIIKATVTVIAGPPAVDKLQPGQLAVPIKLDAEFSKSEAGTRAVLAVAYGATITGAPMIKVNRVVLKVNGEVWADSGQIATSDFNNKVTRQVSGGRTYTAEVTVYSSDDSVHSGTSALTIP